MINLLRRLDRDQFTPMAVLLRSGPLEQDLTAAGVAVRILEKHRMRNPLKVASSIWRIRNLVADEGVKLVHGNGFRAHAYSGAAAALAGVPALWLVHTVELPGLLTQAILQIPAARVITNCPRTNHYFASRRLRTTMIWPTVEPELLNLAAGRAEVSAKYGIPAMARWVSMVARLQRYKGHEFFLRALAALPPSVVPDVHGVVVGGALFEMESGYLAELKRLASQLGIAERIHFVGFVPDDDVWGILRHSELLVHPALDEDFGLSVAEAQASGTAVVAFAAVGPSAIVVDGKTGRLVPVGDQGALNEAVASSLAARERLAEWGRVGRIRALDRFGAARGAEHLEQVYRDVLSCR